MNTEFTVASIRNFNRNPAQCCVVEMEDVLVETLAAPLLTPSDHSVRSWQNRLAFRLNPLSYVSLSSSAPEPGGTLILASLTISDTVRLILALGDAIQRYEKVIAFAFDAGLSDKRYAKSGWQKRTSANYNAIKRLDLLLTPVAQGAAALAAHYDVPVEVMPLAADVLKFGSGGGQRTIDVIGYGRQQREHSDLLSATFNQPGSARTYYHTDHATAGAVIDFYSHRRFFWKMLSSSKLSLAYSHLSVNPANRFKFAFVGQRWFESIAAGCLVVGSKPECPETDQLFAWEDALIELPMETPKVLPFIEALLADTGRLQAAHQRNHHHALLQHDWAYRIAAMLERLQLPRPAGLTDRLTLLTERAAATGTG